MQNSQSDHKQPLLTDRRVFKTEINGVMAIAPLRVCINTINKGGVLLNFLVINTDME